VRVEPERSLSDHEATAGLHDAMQLSERGLLVRDLAEHRDEEGAVEARVSVRERLRVAMRGLDVRDAAIRGGSHEVVEHLALQVEHLEHSSVEAGGDVEGIVAGAGAELEQALAGTRFERFEDSLARYPGPRDIEEKAKVVGAGPRVLALPVDPGREGGDPNEDGRLPHRIRFPRSRCDAPRARA
jgi:hypothetical protein